MNNKFVFLKFVLITTVIGLAAVFVIKLPAVEAQIPVFNTTFLKSYRLLVFTKINGAWPTKDGGYIVSGTSDPNIMFIPPDGFVAKLDKQGGVQWMKFLKTTNAAGVGNTRGDEDVQSVIELKSGGYLMAAKVWGFIKTAESSAGVEVNKILFTKLDKNGNQIWNKSFTAAVEDARNSLVETSDNGFLFYANIENLAPGARGEDSDVYRGLPYASLKVLKLDQNGNLKWAKNIKNFISRDSDNYLVQTADGGFVLAGNIAETNSGKNKPYNFDTYPGIVKFDKDFNFKWAKSLESTPLDLAAAIPTEEGGYKLGSKQVRQPACVIRGMVQTQDNGYLVLGNLAGLSLITNSFDLKTGIKTWLVGFKFSAEGNLEWAKKLTFGFNELTSPVMDFSLTLTADNNLLMVGPITWADDDYQAKVRSANASRDAYCAKYLISEEKCKANQISNIEDSEQTKQDWEKVQALYTITQDAFRPGVFIMNLNDELKTNWAKFVNPQRGVVSYVSKATPDSGAIVAGEYVTDVVKSISFGSPVYYKDGLLIKMDASGNVIDNPGWLIDYTGTVVTELMTPYTVSNDLTVEVKRYSTKLTSRKPELSLYKKSKTTIYAPFSSSASVIPPVAPTLGAHDTPLQNSTITSTATRSWPQINYERAVPVEPINDKSRALNNELSPILNQLYSNQVKLADNMGGTMLSYVFGRAPTKDDMTSVKKSLEGLGYKTQDEGTYQLTMYKPGYWLVMTFSINNASKAFLDITY